MQTEAAFKASSVAGDFGDVIIKYISKVPGSDVAVVQLSLSFKQMLAEVDIINAFLNQLYGSKGGQLPPNHKLKRETFIIGEPSKINVIIINKCN